MKEASKICFGIKDLRWRHVLFVVGRSLFFTLLLGIPTHFSYGADLLDVYRLALRNDPAFEVARYTLKAELEKYPQALAGLLPSVNITGTNNLTRADNRFSNSPAVNRDVHAWNWSLKITQPLIRMQQVYAYDEAKQLVIRAQAQYTLAEQEMILRITQAYFGVMSGREEIKVVEAELSAAEEQYKLAKRGLEKGLAAIGDVLESRSQVDLARSNLVSAKNDLDVKTYELAKIIDKVPEQLSGISPSASMSPPEPDDLQYWVSQARENNPAVLTAQEGLLGAEAAVGRARAEHVPTLDLVASYGENYSSGNATLPNDYASRGDSSQIGLQFTVPLFAGGATNSRISEMRANKYKVGAELEVARRQAAADASLAFAGVKNGLSHIAALESAVQSGLSMVNEARTGFRLGVYNTFKVLDAQQKYFGAQRDLVKARYETLIQALKLKAAAGALIEPDLVAINKLLLH